MTTGTTERPAALPYPLLEPTPGASPLTHLQVRQGRQVLRLAWPTVLAMISHTLMWTVDTILLGHVSTAALGAAGLGGMITWTGYSLVNNQSRITGTFVSQAFGRDDHAAIGDYTWQGLYVALVGGFLLQLAGYFSYLALPLTHNPPEVLDLAYVYIKWRSASAVFTQVSFCLSGFFQGRQRVMTPMWSGLAGNVVNVVLDVWLIFGWQGFELAGRRWLAVAPMGIEGAAIATAIGVLVSALVLIVAAVTPAEYRHRYHIARPRRPDLSRIARILRVGTPAAVENFTDMSAFMMFTVIVGTTGTVALATNQISVQLLSFSFMPVWGLTIAGSVVTGNWIGADRPDQAAAYARQVYKVGIYYLLTLATLLVTLGPLLFRVFSDDPRVVAFGGVIVPILAAFQIGDGLRMISIGVLQGAGDTRFPMLASMVVLWLGFVPLTWYTVAHRGGDITAAWTMGTMVYAVQALVMYSRFRSGAWQRARIFGRAA